MNITIHSGNWEELDVDALAVPMAKGSTVDAALDVRLGGLPSELIDSGEFTGKAGACTLIHRVPDSAVKRVFLIGIGEAPMARHWFATAGQAVRAAAKAKCRSVALLLPHDACARVWLLRARALASIGRAVIRSKNRGRSRKWFC